MAHSSSASSLNTNMTALEDADDVVVPLNLPKIRIWDIHENSTHYDKMVAAPSDRDMYLMWVFWSLIMAIVAVATGFVGMAVLCDKKARKNPFNVYLLGLMAPDFIMSLLCFMTCWVNAATGYFYSVELCYAQSFYFIFGIAANSWLNSMIARQLYKMLVDAKNCIPFQPPTRKAVLLEIFGVYLYASFVASWGLLDLPWLPHHTQLVLGTACIPMDYDTASTIFFYCVFFPALMGGPLVYVLWVLYKIKRDHVLPTTGKRRILTVYFMRLALVFVLMWLPALVFLFIVGAWVPHWVVWAGGAWSHLQGLVSTILSLMKPDVADATRRFAKCLNPCPTAFKDGRHHTNRARSSMMTTFFSRSSTLPMHDSGHGTSNTLMSRFLSLFGVPAGHIKNRDNADGDGANKLPFSSDPGRWKGCEQPDLQPLSPLRISTVDEKEQELQSGARRPLRNRNSAITEAETEVEADLPLEVTALKPPSSPRPVDIPPPQPVRNPSEVDSATVLRTDTCPQHPTRLASELESQNEIVISAGSKSANSCCVRDSFPYKPERLASDLESQHEIVLSVGSKTGNCCCVDDYRPEQPTRLQSELGESQNSHCVNDYRPQQPTRLQSELDDSNNYYMKDSSPQQPNRLQSEMDLSLSCRMKDNCPHQPNRLQSEIDSSQNSHARDNCPQQPNRLQSEMDVPQYDGATCCMKDSRPHQPARRQSEVESPQS